MAYYKDDDYDDDLNYDDDDDYIDDYDDDDDDESLGAGKSFNRLGSGLSSGGTSSSGTSSGGLPGSGRYTSGGGTPFNRPSPFAKPDGDKPASSNPTGVRPFGATSGASGGGASGGGASGGGTPSFRSSSSSTFGGSKPAERPGEKSSSSPFGGGSSGFRSSSPAPTSSGGFNKPSTSPLGGTPSSRPGSSPPPASKPPAKPDDKKEGGGLGGRFGSLLGGGDKKDDKKSASDKKEGGGLGGRFGSLLGGGDKKDDKKPASDKKEGGGLGSALSGVTSRFANPFAKKDGDSSADKKGNPPPGFGSSSGFSSGAPRASGASAGSSAPRFGGATSTAPADKKPAGDKKEGGGFLGGLFKPRGGSGDGKKAQSAFGKSANSGERASGTGQGFLQRIQNYTKRDDAKASAKKTRAKKTPQVATEGGMTLDNWLDILGVGLTFGSLVLFFSAISNEQAAISGIHVFLGQLFGWGSLAVPITMFAVGMWLIIRHFGEEAPTVNPLRLAGLAVAFIALLVIFQYIDSFSYPPDMSLEILRFRLEFAWRDNQSGGGVVGAELYFWLVSTLTEIGGFLVIMLIIIIAAMLITHMSAAEIVEYVAGIWRNARDVMARRAVAQRARRAQRDFELEEKRAALFLHGQQTAPNITVEAPAPAQLQQGAIAGVLPDPDAINRNIRFNMGGQVQNVDAQMMAQAQYGGALPAGIPQQTTLPNFPLPQAPQANMPNDHHSGGISAMFGALGGLLGSSQGGNQSHHTAPPPVELPETPLPMDDPLPNGYTNYNAQFAYNNAPPPPNVPPAQLSQSSPPQPAQPVRPTAPTYSAPEFDVDDDDYDDDGYDDNTYDDNTYDDEVDFTPAPTFNADRNTATRVMPPSPAPMEAQDAPPPKDFDPVRARQDRLNALRQGNTQPPAQQPAAYSAFGRPEDRITHPTEKIPFGNPDNVTRASDLPSAQPIGGEQPYQQPLAINPSASNPMPASQQPSSSPVRGQRKRTQWRLPDYRTLLSVGSEQEFDREHLLKQARIIEETLDSFGAPGRVVEVNTGPVITQFGVEPDYQTGRSGKKQRVKVSAIAALDKDLQLALGAKSIRVEAPVPGKGYVGIEVPNEESSLVSLRDVMESSDFKKYTNRSPLAIALGQSVSGAPISADLASMPHILVAGTTGSGKSVCVNSIITSILAQNTPEQVKFIMVDPKRVELTGYNGIPHLVAPVVVELERIVGVLKWVTREMDDRYTRFSNIGARNIEDYNKHRDQTIEPMPYIVVIIDELADLMMLAPDETERAITRIAALARATGIHLVIATQRPSVDVVTGLIKANFPARIAFAVAGSVDSRVILDQPGAERLLGRGDMLYMSGDAPAPLRLQGVFVSDMEINNIVRYWKMQAIEQPPQEYVNITTNVAPNEAPKEVKPRGERVKQQAFWDSNLNNPPPAARPSAQFSFDDLPSDLDEYESDLDDDAITGDTGGEDDLYEQAVELVRRLERASVSLLQRRLRIGYTRAARLIDTMEARGVIGPSKEGSSKPRDVLK